MVWQKLPGSTLPVAGTRHCDCSELPAHSPAPDNFLGFAQKIVLIA